MNEVNKINRSVKKNYKKQNKLKHNNILDNEFYLANYSLNSTLLGVIDAVIDKIHFEKDNKYKEIYLNPTADINIDVENLKLDNLINFRNIIISFFEKGNEEVIYDYLCAYSFSKNYILDNYLKNNNTYPKFSYNFSEVIKNYIDSYNAAINFEFEDVNKVYSNYQKLVKKYHK